MPAARFLLLRGWALLTALVAAASLLLQFALLMRGISASLGPGVASLRFWKKVPGERLAPAEGAATICGLLVVTDDATGLATSVAPLRIGGRLSQAMPGPG